MIPVLAGREAEAQVEALSQRGPAELGKLHPAVREIIVDVQQRGDRALRDYAARWDGLGADEPLTAAPEEIEDAWRLCRPELRRALRQASNNIRRFARWQLPREWRRKILPGVEVGQIVRPLDSVGCYVPAGRHPLPSTMMMTVILAQVAGVREIVVCSPKLPAELRATAAMLGLGRLFRLGGAQAIAAMAYGTETVPRVEKIVGPGNRFVTAAKQLVAFDCAIDFLAGPTESVLVANQGEPRFIAADLLAQAEHDPDALPVFITCSQELGKAVAEELEKGLKANPSAREAIQRNGRILLATSETEAWNWVNRIAPEHVTADTRQLHRVRNAGSVFLGPYSAQALGDYCSGPNHVLPTGGAARFRGGLSVLDFLKVITVQRVSRSGLGRLGPTAVRLAEAEGLSGHAESVRVRCAGA